MQLISKAMVSSSAILFLTILHHYYGAIIYSTPWRAHVVFFAGPVIGILGIAWLINRARATGAVGIISKWTFILLAGTVSFGLFGLFEGGYNHFLKDAFYFGGVSSQILLKMFPPPSYEMPNDFFFELTGVAQFFVGLWAGYDLFRLIRPRNSRIAGPRSTGTQTDNLGNAVGSV